MYIKHWAAPPFDLQHIQTTSEHAVLEFVLVVSLLGHKCKRKKKENPCTQKKSTKSVNIRSGSTGQMLIRSATVHPKRKARKWKLPSVWTPYHPEPTTWQRNLTHSVLDLLFVLQTSIVTLHLAWTHSCLLTCLKLSKEGWSSSLNSGCYNVVSASEYGQEQGASSLSGESNSFFFILSQWLLWMKLAWPWELPGAPHCQP